MSFPPLLPTANTHMPRPIGIPARFILLAAFSLALLLLSLDSYFNRSQDAKGCHMTYMHPDYVRVDSFVHTIPRLRKYALYLYKERDGRNIGDKPVGIPLLFIPGNAGSYKQARSLGSILSDHYWDLKNGLGWDEKQRVVPFDLFTIDTNEELAAFQGHLVQDQAEYVNEAIKYILSSYSSQPGQPNRQRTSLAIVAHSMGGIVARTLSTLTNYTPESVHTIITLATPHLSPPAPLEWTLTKLYRRINQFWRTELVRPNETLLSNIVLVSIAGGNQDTMISSDAAETGLMVPPSHGFTVYSTGIPFVWTAADHKAILWCNQLVKVLVGALFAIEKGGRVGGVEERMSILGRALKSGIGEHTVRGPLDDSPRSNLPVHLLKPIQGYNLTLSGTSEAVSPRLYILNMPPPSTKLDTFTFITSAQPTDVEVFFCQKKRDESGSYPKACRKISNWVVPLPGEPVLYHAFIPLKQLEGMELMAVNVRSWQGGFFSGEMVNEADTRFSKEVSITDKLTSFEMTLPVKTTLSRLRIPSMANSLLKYHIQWRSACLDGPPLFSPVIHQSFPPFSEEKFLRNSAGDLLSFYGDPQYTAAVPGPTGLELRLWSDGSCKIHIRMSVDWRGSMGRMVGRYMMNWMTFLVGLAIAGSGKIWARSTNGPNPSFLAAVTSLPHLPISVILYLFGVFQTLLVSLPLPVPVATHLSGLLLGNRGIWRATLAPAVYVVSIGLIIVIYGILVAVGYLLGAGLRLHITFGPTGYLTSFVLGCCLVPHHVFCTFALLVALLSRSNQKTISQSHLPVTLLLLLLQPYSIPAVVIWARDAWEGRVWTGNLNPIVGLLVLWVGVEDVSALPEGLRNVTTCGIWIMSGFVILYGSKHTYVGFWAICALFLWAFLLKQQSTGWVKRWVKKER
ncbi:hypothetical protein SpCBS45565_g05747 [Spizellomyces sp. 'palustris']|nr:hypothetical protein SpCBS45565_g05747 [Spizellomyces sp. 'palustris']